MYNHAPDDYDCPFCRLARGKNTRTSVQDDIIYRDDEVFAFVPSGTWPNNRGNVLVVPKLHYENIYDLPPELAFPIQRVVQRIALAFKATYDCDGVSTRQHNEPAGQEEVWHYHLHVFPRYAGDDLHRTDRGSCTPDERRPYVKAARLSGATCNRRRAGL